MVATITKRVLGSVALCVGIIIYIGTAHAADLTVLSPTEGQEFQPGSIIQIQWTETAPLGQEWVPPDVSLELVESGTVLQQIATVTGGAIMYAWSIPGGLSGNVFTIRVTKVQGGEMAESAKFGINPESFIQESLGPFSPKTGMVEWRIGDPVTIMWQPTENWSQALEFYVTSENGIYSWLAGTAQDIKNGTTTFTVPNAIFPGIYFLEVREVGATPDTYSICPPDADPGHCAVESLSYPYLYRSQLIVSVSADPGSYPDGALLREASSSDVWIIKVLPNGRKFRRHVLTPQMASWYGHWGDFWSSVQVVADGTLNMYEISAWIRLPINQNPNTWKIYEVNADMTKHWIMCSPFDDCALAWFQNGGHEAGVYTVNQDEIDAYATGPDVFIQTDEVEGDHDAPVL